MHVPTIIRIQDRVILLNKLIHQHKQNNQIDEAFYKDFKTALEERWKIEENDAELTTELYTRYVDTELKYLASMSIKKIHLIIMKLVKQLKIM